MRNNAEDEKRVLDLFFELINKLSEFNAYVMGSDAAAAGQALLGKYYAFDPSGTHSAEQFRWITLMNCIYTVLNDYGINKKSRGYNYLKDAICIVVDRNTMDICLVKEVYPLIVAKYRLKSITRVEHNIRNAIDSAYYRSFYSAQDVSLMREFEVRPGNKEFILTAAQKVQDMFAARIVNIESEEHSC